MASEEQLASAEETGFLRGDTPEREFIIGYLDDGNIQAHMYEQARALDHLRRLNPDAARELFDLLRSFSAVLTVGANVVENWEQAKRLVCILRDLRSELWKIVCDHSVCLFNAQPESLLSKLEKVVGAIREQMPKEPWEKPTLPPAQAHE